MEKKDKRMVNIEIDDDVRKLTIKGMDKDQQVVMHEELSDDELDNVSGGLFFAGYDNPDIPTINICTLKNQCDQIEGMQNVNNDVTLI